jgi:hypothetical protein
MRITYGAGERSANDTPNKLYGEKSVTLQEDRERKVGIGSAGKEQCGWAASCSGAGNETVIES